MDTRSRKSSKLAKVIIALCVMLPALLLVSLYPTMEEAMIDKREYYDELDRAEKEQAEDWVLVDNFANYAMEASYYLYAEMWNANSTDKLSLDVFNEYGWDNDYWEVRDNTTFIASYTPDPEKESIVTANADKIDASILKLVLEFDSYGNLIEAKCIENAEIYQYDSNVYNVVERSIQQFKNNVENYMEFNEVELNYESYIPKNFKIEFGVDETSDFIGIYEEWYGTHYHDTRAEHLYFEIGAYWVMAVILIFIVFVAMTLPFFKSLNTGKERIFSMSFEVMLVLGILTISGVYLMGYFMAQTTMVEMTNLVESQTGFAFLGKDITAEEIYMLMRVFNFMGWSVVFFMTYALSANIRQFISDTKYYLKYQTLSVRFFRWLKSKIVKLYRYVTDIDLNDNLNKSILKIVIVNFIILTVLCCLWVFGVAGLIIYSIVLFIILKKQGEKIQKQYNSILHATEQMADGDLKISMEEDLGVFQPIGSSLERVQQGFEKAVVEEAKSQNMKTELITNVSHDLKTPLTAIITYVDLLKKEDITEEERKNYIKTLDQKSQRLKVLIEDLFEVSKAHSGNVTMNYMDVDVVSLMKQVRSEMADQIMASGLDFRWSFPEEKVVLSLDGQRTYRVFENLINNALKYSMPSSRVYVDVRNSEQGVQIVFRNVSAQELDFDPQRLTDRFVRGDASRKSEGSGLGLAIAKSFVELQKGEFKIDVDGDLFKVTITWRH